MGHVPNDIVNSLPVLSFLFKPANLEFFSPILSVVFWWCTHSRLFLTARSILFALVLRVAWTWRGPMSVTVSGVVQQHTYFQWGFPGFAVGASWRYCALPSNMRSKCGSSRLPAPPHIQCAVFLCFSFGGLCQLGSSSLCWRCIWWIALLGRLTFSVVERANGWRLHLTREQLHSTIHNPSSAEWKLEMMTKCGPKEGETGGKWSWVVHFDLHTQFYFPSTT